MQIVVKTKIILPNYAGNWGAVGGVLGLLGGVGYIVFTLLEVRKTRKRAQVAASDHGAGC